MNDIAETSLESPALTMLSLERPVFSSMTGSIYVAGYIAGTIFQQDDSPGTTGASEPQIADQLLYVHEGHQHGGWKLTQPLLVQATTNHEGVFVDASPTVSEYGVGSSFDEAIEDLLVSMSEYLESLQGHENHLGDLELSDLKTLRILFRSLTE